MKSQANQASGPESLSLPNSATAAVRPIVRHHHELRDGSGYPDGLRGDEIPLLAQIVAIVDAYDAITTTRPYRTALPVAHAYAELRQDAARGLRRPDLVEVFVRLGAAALQP